jgi:hypothetical protein
MSKAREVETVRTAHMRFPSNSGTLQIHNNSDYINGKIFVEKMCLLDIIDAAINLLRVFSTLWDNGDISSSQGGEYKKDFMLDCCAMYSG